MNRMFGDQSPLVIGVKKILDIILLNFLWLAASIPVVTIGISTSAFYEVVYKDIWHDRGSVFLDYLSALKRNWKPGLWAGIIMTGASVVLWMDFSLLRAAGEAGFLWGNCSVLAVLFGGGAALWFVWVSAGIARFDAPLKTICKNSLALLLTHLPASLAVGGLLALCTLCIWLIPGALFLLPALCMLACCRITNRIFWLYMSEEDRQKEAEQNKTKALAGGKTQNRLS